MLRKRDDDQACQEEARNRHRAGAVGLQTTSDFHESRTDESDPEETFGRAIQFNALTLVYQKINNTLSRE